MKFEFSKIKIGDLGHSGRKRFLLSRKYSSCARLFSNQQTYIIVKINATNLKCRCVKSIKGIGDVVYMIT